MRMDVRNVFVSGACFLAAAVRGSGGECRANGGEVACLDELPSLKWRGFPYQLSDPKYARTIYGGNIVKDAFAEQGFDGPVDGDDWDILWTHRSQDLSHLQFLERAGTRVVNQCTYFRAAGNKCALHNHIALSRLHGHLRSFDVTDVAGKDAFRREVESDPARYWVLKPCSAGASQGIQVLAGAEAVAAVEKVRTQVVAQEYMLKPYMGYGHRKFHLRLYLFIPRWSHPVRAYLYEEGLIFRSHSVYDENRPPNYARDVFSGVSKTVEVTSIAPLWETLASSPSAHASPASIRSDIMANLRELFSNPEVSFGNFSAIQSQRSWSCFDLLGADVILDENLKPWLMEINSGPNLWVSNHGKKHEDQLTGVKDPLLKQILHWAKLRSRKSMSIAAEDADSIEKKSLIGFTRIN